MKCENAISAASALGLIVMAAMLVKALCFNTPESRAMRECIQTAPGPVCEIQLGLRGK